MMESHSDAIGGGIQGRKGVIGEGKTHGARRLNLYFFTARCPAAIPRTRQTTLALLF